MIKINKNEDVEISGTAGVVLAEFAGVTKAIYSALSEQYSAETARTTLQRIVEHSTEKEEGFDHESSSRVVMDILNLLE